MRRAWQTIVELWFTRPFSWQCPALHPLGWQRCTKRPFHRGGHDVCG